MKVKDNAIGLTLVIIFTLTLSARLLTAQNVSDADRKQAQAVAQRFVKRMHETRDVGQLTEEMFLPDFISHFECDDVTISRSIYSRLSSAERRRLFIARTNIAYLVSIDVISGTDYILANPQKTAFTGILPAEMSERLRRTLSRFSDSSQFSSYSDFKSRLPMIEKILLEAREYLKKLGIKQPPKLQEALGTGLNYKVTVSSDDGGAGACWKLGQILSGHILFRVETPLFFGILLVKDRNRMKIVSVVDGTDD